ncbi:MAG: hypothetical protein HY475_01010 [Candidatus Terrybacteria bacterium]|nr:hypothetical protein [Candidatus Terrybacteria bacterium]
MGATAILIGTIVGAGIFALPAAAARAGFPITLVWFLLLTVAVWILHLMYGEVVLRGGDRHRLPGYAAQYLGRSSARLAGVAAVAGGIGALLVYIALADVFLTALFPGVFSSGQWGVAAWGALTLAVAFGIRTVARVELVMTAFLLAAMAIIITALAPRIAGENLLALGSFSESIVPYGVLLFSLWGINAIPEMRGLTGAPALTLRRTISLGTLIPAALYLLFVAAVIGAFGNAASGDLPSLLASLGPQIFYAVAVFGALAVATSFLVLGAYFVDTFRYDFRFPYPAALLMLASPMLFFAAGVRDAAAIMGIVGTILGVVDGVLIVRVWRAARMSAGSSPAYAVRLPAAASYAMMALFIGAAAAEVASFLV